MDETAAKCTGCGSHGATLAAPVKPPLASLALCRTRAGQHRPQTRKRRMDKEGQEPLPKAALPYEDHPEAPDASLGGYFDVHNRPPAFEGSNGRPYTVSIEVEKAADPRTPFVGYLVFPQWADTGLGIVGHVETRILWKGASRRNVIQQAGALSLEEVKALLEQAIQDRGSD